MKGQPSTPQSYNPYEVMQAAGQANIGTAAAQSALNAVDRYNPFYSTTYNQRGSYSTPYGNVPEWAQSTQFGPLGQTIMKYAQPGAQAAGQYLAKGPQQMDQQATNAIYGQEKSFLDPQWNMQQQQMQDQLSRAGVSVGNQAYGNANQQFDNSRTQAYQSAQDQAIAGGSQAAQNLENMAIEGQAAPVNLLNAMMSGGQEPYPQSNVQPIDTTGAFNQYNTGAQNQYMDQNQQWQQMWGGLSQLMGAGMMFI